MEPNKNRKHRNLVLDLASFQLVRDGAARETGKDADGIADLTGAAAGHVGNAGGDCQKAFGGDAVHVDVEAGINTAISEDSAKPWDDDSASPRYPRNGRRQRLSVSWGQSPWSANEVKARPNNLGASKRFPEMGLGWG